MELVWGFKSSFVDYVERMSDGAISIHSGAVRDSAGFHFPLVSRSIEELRFSGSVEFSGHFGMLYVAVTELRIRLDGENAVVSIDDDGVRLDLATGQFRGDVLDSLALTSDGAELFFDVYHAGDPLDPAQLVASTGE